MLVIYIIILSIKEWWKFVFFHENACVALSVLPLGKVYYLVLHRKSLVISGFSRFGRETLESGFWS